jgi:hypothetical protein
MSETLATGFFGAGGAAGAAAAEAAFIGGACFAEGGACVRAAGLGSASFFFGATFVFDPALLVAGADLRAGVFAAVLLVVLVAI